MANKLSGDGMVATGRTVDFYFYYDNSLIKQKDAKTYTWKNGKALYVNFAGVFRRLYKQKVVGKTLLIIRN